MWCLIVTSREKPELFPDKICAKFKNEKKMAAQMCNKKC